MPGGMPAQTGIAAPPTDSGILGPIVPPDGLTVTLGLGASIFDNRYRAGSSRKPSKLRRMDTFVNDNLDRTICDGDLLLQICADNGDTVVHALRDLARETRGFMQPRWRIDGNVPPPRAASGSAAQSLMGFTRWDGESGRHRPGGDGQTRVGPARRRRACVGDRAAAIEVVRVIRMLVELWDQRFDTSEQERMIGRRKDSGAPLSGTVETDLPEYTDDAERCDDATRQPYPRREPPYREDEQEPHPAAWLQLRRGHRQQRQPRHGARSSPASSRTSTASSSPSRDGWPTSRSSTTSRRSAAATTSYLPASADAHDFYASGLLT